MKERPEPEPLPRVRTGDPTGAVRVLLWALLVAACFVVVQNGILPALGTTRGDFANYYTASRLVAEGVSLEPAYRDFSWFQKQMDRYGIENQVGGFIPHPPPTALVFLPLVPLDAHTAKGVWTYANILLIIFNIALLARTSRLHWLPCSVLFFATGYGLLNNLVQGQLYLLLQTSILLAVYFFQQGKPLAAGLCLGSLSPVKYIGVLFVSYFVWKKHWKVVLAAAGAISVLVMSSVLLDMASFQEYVSQVLPRHLKGEIQDPYAVNFQSWNSLFRRLFLFEPTLNPNPALVSPPLYFLSKNLVHWILAGVAIFVAAHLRFPVKEQQLLFYMGWIPLVVLLISPAGATYHFLLLTITAVYFGRILLDLGRVYEAWGLGILFGVINLPHYMELRTYASGWQAPLGYSRLWFLLIFFGVAIYLFRRFVTMPRRTVLWYVVVCLFLAGLNTLYDSVPFGSTPRDLARRLTIPGSEFQPHLSLILQDPDLGGQQVVFSYCALLEDDYEIFSAEGRPWFSQGSRNYYGPDLASDDQSLLVETVENGRDEIWLSRGVGQPPAFLIEGRSPGWHPDGNGLVFEREGELYVFDLQAGTETSLECPGRCYDPSFSPEGDSVLYAVRQEGTTSLRVLDLASRKESILFQALQRIESPQWSGDGRKIVFSADFGNNQDIWGLNLADDSLVQLTLDPALDRDPIWDEAHSRILFMSDRDRGLACTTLYEIPIPEGL